ncbi:hypothetical protein YB2330_004147 [Saitoella coloradoensis]
MAFISKNSPANQSTNIPFTLEEYIHQALSTHNYKLLQPPNFFPEVFRRAPTIRCITLHQGRKCMEAIGKIGLEKAKKIDVPLIWVKWFKGLVEDPNKRRETLTEYFGTATVVYDPAQDPEPEPQLEQNGPLVDRPNPPDMRQPSSRRGMHAYIPITNAPFTTNSTAIRSSIASSTTSITSHASARPELRKSVPKHAMKKKASHSSLVKHANNLDIDLADVERELESLFGDTPLASPTSPTSPGSAISTTRNSANTSFSDGGWSARATTPMGHVSAGVRVSMPRAEEWAELSFF